MTVTIELSPQEDARLAAAARRAGLPPREYAHKLVSDHLPATEAENPVPEDPTLALFKLWEEEDAQMTPEEVAEAQREFEEFKDNINAERDRAGARRVFS